MKELHEIQTTTGATRDYWSFYPRYFEALKSYALRFHRARGIPCDGDEAGRLAHDFILEHHELHERNKGFLRRYCKGRRFRPYVVVVFRNFLRQQVAPRREQSLPLEEELPGTTDESPEASLLAEELEQLRRKVREAILAAAATLTEAERAYLELKYSVDADAPPRSDREVGGLLAARGLLNRTTTESRRKAVVHLKPEVVEKFKRRIAAKLEGHLLDEYVRHMSEEKAIKRTNVTLATLFSILNMEEEAEESGEDPGATPDGS